MNVYVRHKLSYDPRYNIIQYFNFITMSFFPFPTTSHNNKHDNYKR
jgi:hypothetical protein